MEQELFMAALTFPLHFVSLSEWNHHIMCTLQWYRTVLHVTAGFHALAQHLIEESEMEPDLWILHVSGITYSIC